MSQKIFHLTYLILLTCLGSLCAQHEELGVASFFSDDFHGRSTAYGDAYNKNELVAAHKRYPYGTMLRVINLANNKSVVVKVIDKGPFVKGRVVDLSRRAAELLGFVEQRTARVRVEPLSDTPIDSPDPPAEAEYATIAPPPTLTEPEERPRSFADDQLDPRRNPLADSEDRVATPGRETKATPEASAAEKTEVRPQTTIPVREPAQDRARLINREDLADGVYHIILKKPTNGIYAVQVASFSNLENVLQRVAELQEKWFDNILISTETTTDGRLYRVLLGPFADQKTAQHYQENLASRYKIRGFVTTLVKP
ncbi:MAG: septal ring lytic transglycosylase RlpA family protein [Bacteroidetes bacterium]|nr:MAG: septal ring lytic transglycosylase RlpA family protein [Bacteroidota bacterium]